MVLLTSGGHDYHWEEDSRTWICTKTGVNRTHNVEERILANMGYAQTKGKGGKGNKGNGKNSKSKINDNNVGKGNKDDNNGGKDNKDHNKGKDKGNKDDNTGGKGKDNDDDKDNADAKVAEDDKCSWLDVYRKVARDFPGPSI